MRKYNEQDIVETASIDVVGVHANFSILLLYVSELHFSFFKAHPVTEHAKMSSSTNE